MVSNATRRPPATSSRLTFSRVPGRLALTRRVAAYIRPGTQRSSPGRAMPWSPGPLAVKRPGRRPAPAGSAPSTLAPPRASQPADGGSAAGWPAPPGLVTGGPLAGDAPTGGPVAAGAALGPGASGRSGRPTIWAIRTTIVSAIATAASSHSAT